MGIPLGNEWRNVNAPPSRLSTNRVDVVMLRHVVVKTIVTQCLLNIRELISQTGLHPIPDASHNERLRQYAQVSLQPLLAEQGWCSLVPELLASPEHDWKEKALRTILAIMPQCHTPYRQDNALSSSLSALQEQYQELVLTEQVLGDEDGYFGEILALLEIVVLKLKQA